MDVEGATEAFLSVVTPYLDNTQGFYKTTDVPTEIWDALNDYRAYLTNWKIGRDRADQQIHMRNRLLEHSRPRSDEPRYFFITINPDEKYWQLNDFVKSVKKYLHLKLFDGCLLNFEQRGSEGGKPMGTGFHTHIVAQTHEHKSTIKQRLERSFPNSQIWFPPKGDEVNIPAKMDYIKGVKSEDKMAKVDYDKVWRKQHNLEPWYSTLPCVEDPATN